MPSTRYERVASTDDDATTPTATTPIPSSPPPSFHSRDSSPPTHTHTSRRSSSTIVDRNLADAFDADTSDSEDEEEEDGRQRLMRETAASPGTRSAPVEPQEARSPPVATEARSTHAPSAAGAPTSGRVYGGGSGDGVFANLSAKPDPGEKLEEHPPTYEQAAADAAPPYWETTILAPGLGGPDEVYVEGLPVGSIFSFLWNAMISMSFQLVGFLLTYLLHTTHAAKNGSRAGLGITLIQYGFYMKGNADVDGSPPSSDPGNVEPQYVGAADPDSHDFDAGAIAAAAAAQAASAAASSASGDDGASKTIGGLSANEWASYALMIIGWFILIRAVSDYLRARRHEQLVLQSPDRGLGTAVVAEGEAAETVV